MDASFDITGCFEDIAEISGGAAKAPEAASTGPAKAPEVASTSASVGIDANITSRDMLTVIEAELRRRGISGHHISSMNFFYGEGLRQIICDVFAIEKTFENKRVATETDRSIKSINFSVKFTKVNIAPPTTFMYISGASQQLTPSTARVKNFTYSVGIMVDATIEATATLHGGGTIRRDPTYITNHRLATIPCMLRSNACTTYGMSAEALKEVEEDPLNPGGYFIINGNEWTVDCLENLTNNSFHVFKTAFKNEIVRGTFISKPGDGFENSYQIVIKYLNSGAIIVETTTNKTEHLILPFYLLFRCVGITDDREIVDHIVYGSRSKDETTRQLMAILNDAFVARTPQQKKDKMSSFDDLMNEIDPQTLTSEIGRRIAESGGATIDPENDDQMRYANSLVHNHIDKFILPHIGNKPEHRIQKMRFIGHLINRLLRVHLNVVEPTDRDSYKNKRVTAAGISLAKAFKTHFNLAVVRKIRETMHKKFEDNEFTAVRLDDVVKSAIQTSDLEKALGQAISTGDKKQKINKMEITNRVASQQLYNKNDLNVKSTLNTVHTANSSSSKQNERADEMRRVHPTYIGFIDVTQSSESGEKVGVVKQLCCTASITDATSTAFLKDVITHDPDFIRLDMVPPHKINSEKLAKLFVNGDWIGCCKHVDRFAAKYRQKRRTGDIHEFTTIYWDVLSRELYFWTDFGRIVRPLVIVYNNLEEYVAARKAGNKDFEFRQWIKLTKQDIVNLRAGRADINDLRRREVIEYISPDEQENAFLAPNINILRQHENSIEHMYTHCDIDQAICGLVTLASPLTHHSSATRNTYYTCHRKQSAGWFALNWPYRINKGVTLQHYCEVPIVSCFSDNITYPNGQNCIIALTCHGGENQEDSVKVNQSSVDCGMFNASYFDYVSSKLEKGEEFTNIDMSKTIDHKKNANYEYIGSNGLAREGSYVRSGHVLISKRVQLANNVGASEYGDRSIIHKHDEVTVVDKAILTRDHTDANIAKVRLRSNRPLGIADKVSSRTGNKGIVCKKVPRCDMPYTEEGLVPDILVNAQSIPSRMAINQIIETTLGLLGAKRGTRVDATSFLQLDINAVVKELEGYGMKNAGHQRMFNGELGEPIDTLIFVGPTTYQRLQKYVIDDHYAMRTGPNNELTRQPREGKNSDGGLKIGEMEFWTIMTHGSMRAFHQKLYEDSDGFTIPVCRRCGDRALVNVEAKIYSCNNCGDAADIAVVPSSWVTNLFMHEISSMNVKLKLDLEKPRFQC